MLDPYLATGWWTATRSTAELLESWGRANLGACDAGHRTDLHQDRSRHIWGNRSDAATLRNHHDRLDDKTTWGTRHHGGHH